MPMWPCINSQGLLQGNYTKQNQNGFSLLWFQHKVPFVYNVSGILRVEDVPGKVLGLLPSWRLLS